MSCLYDLLVKGSQTPLGMGKYWSTDIMKYGCLLTIENKEVSGKNSK